jgi:AcrR family transcriptional regulator
VDERYWGSCTAGRGRTTRRAPHGGPRGARPERLRADDRLEHRHARQRAQGTFYLYFPSKEALPGALALQFSEALAVANREALEGITDLEVAVDALVRSSWEAASEHRDIIMIANRGIELAETFEQFLEYTAPHRKVLEEFLTRFQASGEIEPTLNVVTTTYVLRDLLDRSLKAKLCFGQDEWAEQTSVLVRRALAA